MVARKTVGGSTLSLTQAYFKKGARIPRHTYDSERLIYILQGALRLVTDADDETLREGELLVVPPGLAHEIEVLDDAFVLAVSSVED